MTLQTHLDGGATTIARCWRIERLDGTLHGFTDHDRTLTIDGLDYEPETGLTASAFADTTGLAVNEMEVTGILSGDAISLADLEGGRLDGAQVDYMLVNWADPSERAIVSIGYLGETLTGPVDFLAALESIAKATAFEKALLLTPRCGLAFGEPVDPRSGRGCGLDLTTAAYTAVGAVLEVGGDRNFTVTGLDAYAEDWFSRGFLRWTTGANAGRIEKVAAHAAGAEGVRIDLAFARPGAIAAADAFTIVAGCDRSAERCRMFGNYARFGGFEHMPSENVATKAVTDPANPEPTRTALTPSSPTLADPS